MSIFKPEGQMNPEHDEDFSTAEGRKMVKSVIKTIEENLPAGKRLFWTALAGINLLFASVYVWFVLLPSFSR